MTPDKVEAALTRVANLVKMMKAKPIGGLHDEFYGIHTGTEWEASLRFSDLSVLTEALAERERDAARLEWPEGVEFIAEVMPDWTTLQTRHGTSFAFNRMNGRVYKLPHPECPFVILNLPKDTAP